MARMGKYLYCFIREKESLAFGNSEIGGLNAPVYNIAVKDLSAVVSDAPVIDYDPNRKNLTGHQKVLSRIMESYQVVPVSFGTVSRSKSDVENLIDRYYDDLSGYLEKLKDKVELGLKVTWDDAFFNMDIEDDEITSLKNKISGKPENEVLTDKITLGRMVEKAIFLKRDKYMEEIFTPLDNIAYESKINDKLAIRTVINAYFLVAKSREEEFDRKVEALAGVYEGKLAFLYTGPWPPYNFVDLNIHLE